MRSPERPARNLVAIPTELPSPQQTCILPPQWLHSTLLIVPFSLFLVSITTNKIQHYTMYLLLWNALHVSGGSSAHHQERKTVYTASGTCQALLLPVTVVEELELVSSFPTPSTTVTGISKAWQVPDAVYTVLSSWWWAEDPPETYRACHRNKYIV
jgi:hypothetical protein